MKVWSVNVAMISGLMRVATVLMLSLPLAVGAGGSWGCGRQYSQATPDDVLESARSMVQNGDVHRLPDLVYAETPELRTLMTRLGTVLASMQSLALELHRAYPEEIAEIKKQAEEAAARGEATGFVGRMMSQAAPTRRPPGGRRRGQTAPAAAAAANPESMQQSFNQMAKELFADPYGWLERSEGRVSTQKVADDLAAIMWDGKPAFGVGLLMKEEGGKWYITLPTSMPGVGQMMPKSDETWQIAGSLTVAINNAIKDTEREVKAGKHPTLEDLARSVGEKAAIPAIAIMYAYQRATRVERQEERQREREASTPAPAAAGG
jgi:hypothetical protein